MKGYCRKCKDITKQRLSTGGYKCCDCGRLARFDKTDRELRMLEKRNGKRYK